MRLWVAAGAIGVVVGLGGSGRAHARPYGVAFDGGSPSQAERVVPPRPRDGFIHDGGPILTPAAIEAFNQRIAAVQASGRGDIGVAIVRDLEGIPPFEAGTAIYRAWKIGAIDTLGSARRDLGVLLLIVPKELAPDGKGECWITTGVGAEGIVTDLIAARICREMVVPLLRDKAYEPAVRAGIEALAAVLTDQVAPAPSEREPGARSLVGEGGSGGGGSFPFGLVGSLLLGGGGLIGGVAGVRSYRRRKPRLCPNGHGEMHRLDERADDAGLVEGQRVEEEVKSVDYDVWVCDQCDERLVLRYKRWLTSHSKCPSCSFWTVKSRTRTIVSATTSSGGLAETTRTCRHCAWTETRRHATPRLSSSSSSSGSRSSGGRSFGGSGRSSGGGGGSSY